MANGHGGARAGSGRKPKAQKYGGEVLDAERKIVDRLPELVDNLLQLAAGGYERVEEEWLPAGMVAVKAPVMTPDGPLLNEAGRPVLVEQPAFPDKPVDELVLVKCKVSIADRDRAANIYLIDRIMGKPTEVVEADLTSNGETIRTVFYIPANGRERDEPPGDPAELDPPGDVPGDVG